jgi:hypothetical protein
VIEKASEERKSSEEDKEEGPELIRKGRVQPVRKVPMQPVRKVPILAAVSSVEDTSCPVAGEAVKHAITGGCISAESRHELSTFISKSVLPQTTQVYNKDFAAWQDIIKIETGRDDPFLTGFSDNDKASLVSLMMLRRHQSGKRGKAATAFTAAIRMMFSRMTLSTTFLDSAIIATASTSCLMKPGELRVKKDQGHLVSVKLPVCQDMLADMKQRLMREGDLTDEGMRGRATSLGAMFGYEMAGRIGEYTHSERNQVNHCVRVDDATFAVEIKGTITNIPGSGLTALKLKDSIEGRRSILECRVRAVTSKGKVMVKPKLIGRRSPEETTFLDNLAS